jgi:hypothetical protein
VQSLALPALTIHVYESIPYKNIRLKSNSQLSDNESPCPLAELIGRSTCLEYKGKGEVVWLYACLLHLIIEFEGFFTGVIAGIASDHHVP